MSAIHEWFDSGRRAALGALLALGAALACAASGAGTPRGAGAFLGSWQFDPAKSSFHGAVPYESAVYTFRDTHEGVHVIAELHEAGRVLHFEYVDRQDGTFVPVTGNPFYDSESTRWTDARTATRTERRAGHVTGQTRMTVSPDGQSLTAVASRTLPDGRLYESRIVWNRRKP
jgi:hypothetical protein